VGASVTHVASSFDNASNTARVPGYILADIRAAYDLTKQISLYGRIENLFNEQYETVLRFGTLGRAAYAGVRLRYR
jgi:vitamin B12 transporter